MILNISHVTTYSYSGSVRSAVQSLRLTPSRFDGQRTVRWQISIEGGQKGGTFRDGAGDWIEGWSLRGPLTGVTVRAEGTVETTDLAGVLRGHREHVPPATYLRDTEATRTSAALEALATEAAQDGSGGGMLSLAHALSGLVADRIAYRPGTTTAHTTAARALEQGEGVCQDHAHALISVARLRGLPARYVSGYLFADASGQPHEAAHAWAEIWVEGLGWVGFDPANRCCPDDRYVRLGSGYDAQDAAPIRGLAIGAAAENLTVEVAVGAAQQ